MYVTRKKDGVGPPWQTVSQNIRDSASPPTEATHSAPASAPEPPVPVFFPWAFFFFVATVGVAPPSDPVLTPPHGEGVRYLRSVVWWCWYKCRAQRTRLAGAGYVTKIAVDGGAAK